MRGGGTQIGNQSPRLKWEKKGEEELKKKKNRKLYYMIYINIYVINVYLPFWKKKKNRENQGRGREKQAISPFSCLPEINKCNASFFFFLMSCRRSIDCSLLTALGAHPQKQNRTVFSLLSRVKYQREKGKPSKKEEVTFFRLSH